jgi:hypothetical protein
MNDEHEEQTSLSSTAEQRSGEQGNAQEGAAESITSMFRDMLGNDSSKMDFDLTTRLITMLAQRVGPPLDLNRLVRWEVAEDIHEAAERLSTELGQEIHLTKTENSVSAGRVIHTDAGCIVLVPAASLRQLIDGPDGAAQLTINLLHHELCHVHDEAVRNAMPGWPGPAEEVAPLTNFMVAVMIWLWDEYSANRRSAKTALRGLEQAQFELVAKEFPRAQAEIDEAIRSFLIHQDMSRLTPQLTSSFGHLFKLLGYALGSSAGRGETLEQLDPASYGFLRETWLASLLSEESVSQLNTLYETFGTWSGLEVFDEFAETCREVYWDAGVQIHEKPTGGLRMTFPMMWEALAADEDEG